MLPLFSANDPVKEDLIMMTIVPLVGSPFFMGWSSKEEEDALHYANTQLKHWSVDCVHLEYENQNRTITLEKSI